MERGRGLYTPVVFTLDDLQEIYDKDAHGKIGMWAFHSKFHVGHQSCADKTNEVCDWVIGILWNNFAAGMKWIMGDSIDIDDKIRPSDVNHLKNYSDVVMIFTGDYHPFKDHWETIKSIINEDFPDSFLKEKGVTEELNIHSSLIYSVAARILMHEIYNLKLDYHASCGRDRWRHVKYQEWLKSRYGITLDLQDAVRDDYGNVVSGMRSRVPEEYNKRINKPLLLPHFNSLEEVNDYIKDISDLRAVHFAKEYGWIHVKFQFANKHWWSEGLKLCKS